MYYNCKGSYMQNVSGRPSADLAGPVWYQTWCNQHIYIVRYARLKSYAIAWFLLSWVSSRMPSSSPRFSLPALKLPFSVHCTFPHLRMHFEVFYLITRGILFDHCAFNFLNILYNFYFPNILHNFYLILCISKKQRFSLSFGIAT